MLDTLRGNLGSVVGMEVGDNKSFSFVTASAALAVDVFLIADR